MVSGFSLITFDFRNQHFSISRSKMCKFEEKLSNEKEGVKKRYENSIDSIFRFTSLRHLRKLSIEPLSSNISVRVQSHGQKPSTANWLNHSMRVPSLKWEQDFRKLFTFSHQRLRWTICRLSTFCLADIIKTFPVMIIETLVPFPLRQSENKFKSSLSNAPSAGRRMFV